MLKKQGAGNLIYTSINYNDQFFDWQKLKKINLLKCEKIGNQTFLHFDKINEICISKNIDLQPNYTRQFFQSILDKGGVLKYIDEDSKKI